MIEFLKVLLYNKCYFTEKFHDPEDEPSAPLYDKSYEDSELTIEQWKKLAFDEICNFKFSPDLIVDY